jgi:hypothetical protein
MMASGQSAMNQRFPVRVRRRSKRSELMKSCFFTTESAAADQPSRQTGQKRTGGREKTCLMEGAVVSTRERARKR